MAQPNILLVVSDEERRNDWLRRKVPDVAGKTFDVDADFDDQDHEWYETGEDPHELTNLVNDRGRRNELRGLFDRLKAMETTELRPT